MKRRNFLKSGLYGAGAAALSGGISLAWPNVGFAAHSAATVPRTLVNIMLLGGADLRFAFVPTPTHDPVYVDQFWTARNARSTLYTQGYPDYASMYAAEYQTVTDAASGFSFGIHNSCGWLVQQFNAGNVAIVANAFGSLNRRHDHSQNIVNTGDAMATQFILDRDGWGGRLAEAATGVPNVVSISPSVSLFSKGTDPTDRLAQVIHGKDMRNIALPNVDPALNVDHSRNVTRRALIAYYKERGIEIESEKPGSWPYRRFFKHNDSLRFFGGQIDARLADHSMPASLASLDLNRNEVELQSRNIYDCCLTPDILNLKVISMTVNGWDSHVNEQSSLSRYLQDILGTGGGLDTVTTQLAADVPTANDNLVYSFSSDFGRQLAVNGDRGTDHGRGSYSILVGNDVNGGVYGEMFPQREAIPDPADSQGRTAFEIPGRDIDGLTSVERINSLACDWAAPGTGSIVFPSANSSDIETGVDLSGLFTV